MIGEQLMAKLYRRNIWADFVPIAVPDAVEGWNGNHQSLILLGGVGQVVIDVGVRNGQSTITLARAMKDRGIDGCVIAIDTFLGSVEHWTVDGELFERNHGRPMLYETFISNVIKAGVQDYVIPMPQTSVSAAKILRRPGISAAVAHVDAAHEYEEALRILPTTTIFYGQAAI
jgi:hypothetical protein